MDSTLTLAPADAVDPGAVPHAIRDSARASLDFGMRAADPAIEPAPSLAPTIDPLAPEPRGRRPVLAFAAIAVAIVLGAGGTLGWQSWGSRTASSTGPTSAPVATTPSVPADLAQQLETLRRDVASTRQALDRLSANQEQMAQTIAKLQASEQDAVKKLSAAHPRPASAAPPSRPAVLGAPPRSLGTLPATSSYPSSAPAYPPAGSQPYPSSGSQMSASPLPPPQTIGPPR